MQIIQDLILIKGDSLFRYFGGLERKRKLSILARSMYSVCTQRKAGRAADREEGAQDRKGNRSHIHTCMHTHMHNTHTHTFKYTLAHSVDV